MTTAPDPLRTISYGGGVQSTALLVLAGTGRIDFPVFLMANVGDDSEHPDTLKYVRLVAAPWAEEHGITLHVLDRRKRDGTVETLWSRLIDPRPCRVCRGTGVLPADQETEIGPAWPTAVAENLAGDTRPCEGCAGAGKVESRSLPIPVRMDNGAPGNRSCTADFKIRVTAKWLKQNGASAETPATIGIGISLDEIQRANSRKHEEHERVVYPLIGIGEETGLKMRRSDCEQLIRDTPLSPAMSAHLRSVADELPRGTRQQLERTGYAYLPVPPKSSCFFCPFHKETAWEDLARDHPDLFEKSCELEDILNRRRSMLGKDHVYLTRFARPLREVINDGQELLPLADGDGACDSGWCFT